MKCIRKGCKNNAIIDPIYGVLPCADCQKKDERFSITRKPPEFYSIDQMGRVQRQRDKHAKDMIQPFIRNQPNPDFAKAFPSKAKDYFTADELKRL